MGSIIPLEFIRVAFIVGILLGFYFATKYKISSGGIIVPGYIAYLISKPSTIPLIFVISILTYIIMEYFYKKYMIIYGRKKFMLNVITGALFSFFIDAYLREINSGLIELPLIGMVTPGIIANEFERGGGVFKTLFTTLILAIITYLIAESILTITLRPFLFAIAIFIIFSFFISSYQSYELKKKIGIDPLRKKRAYRKIIKLGSLIVSRLPRYIFFWRRT